MQEILSPTFSSHIYMIKCGSMNGGWMFNNLRESLFSQGLADQIVRIPPEVDVEVPTDDSLTASDVTQKIILEFSQIPLVIRIR